VKTISIAAYAEDCALVLRCGEQIAHAIATDGIDEREVRLTLFGLAALLGMVNDRLTVLRRMVVGEADPGGAWSDRVRALPGSGADVVLPAWKPEVQHRRRKAKP